MAFDPDKYLSEKTGGATTTFDPDQYLAEKTGQPKAEDISDPIKDAIGWAGHQLTRVPAAIRGGVEQIQNGNGTLAGMSMGAARGFIHPDSVQTSPQMMARFGADTTRYPVNYPQLDAPFTRGSAPILPAQSGTSSHADAAGEVFDALAPTGLEFLPAPAAFKGAKTAAKATAGAIEKAGTSAAERAILEQYNPTLMKELAPAISGSSTIKDAPAIVAQKLREHDLLYNPGKANFNLQRDIRKTGEQIGQVVEAGKQQDLTVNIQKVYNDFLARKDAALKETGKGAASADAFQADAAPRIQAIIDRLQPNELGEVPLDKAVNLKRELQDMVKNWSADNGKPLIQGAAQELQADLNNAIAASDPKIGPKLAGLNNKYSDLMELEPLITDAYSKGFGKAAAGKTAQGGLPKVVEAFAGENGKPMLKSFVKAVADLPKTVVGLGSSDWREALANKGRFDYPDMYASMPLPQVPADALQAIKAPFVDNGGGGLAPRQPYMRRPLEPKAPTYVPQQNDAAPTLAPRQPTNGPRRPLSPIAPDPSLDVIELGKVLDADAAKEIAANKYQSERLSSLWQKVREAKTPKQRSALMNLIRAVHSSKGK